MKRLFSIAALGVAVIVAFLAYRCLFPTEDQRIRRMLAGVADAVSVPPDPKPLGNLVAVQKLIGFFAADAEIVVDAPEVGKHSLAGRDEIMQAVLAVRSNVKGLKVEFLDIDVAVDSQKQTAVAGLTAKATVKAERDFGVPELRMQMVKTDGHWLITRVETVKTLSL